MEAKMANDLGFLRKSFTDAVSTGIVPLATGQAWQAMAKESAGDLAPWAWLARERADDPTTLVALGFFMGQGGEVFREGTPRERAKKTAAHLAKTTGSFNESSVLEMEMEHPSIWRQIVRRGQANLASALAETFLTKAIGEKGLRGEDALTWACERGDAAMVHALLDAGFDADSRTPEGGTPLRAAIAGHARSDAEQIDALNALCQRLPASELDRDDNDLGFRGRPQAPLAFAIALGRERIAAALVKMGADPDKAGDMGHSARYWAEELGWTELGQAIAARDASRTMLVAKGEAASAAPNTPTAGQSAGAKPAFG
jgi:hypothetical protein